jgi:hypothetical protein
VLLSDLAVRGDGLLPGAKLLADLEARLVLGVPLHPVRGKFSRICSRSTVYTLVSNFELRATYSSIEIVEQFLQGVFASGANFFIQSWCISVKGPLYSAIFTPLSAVITAMLSTLFLHEELHIGRYVSLPYYSTLFGK